MLSRQEAQQLVEAQLSSRPPLPGGDKIVVVPSATIERAFGWVFFYESQRKLETGEVRYALAGNAPFIVNRHTGEIVATGTARPVEHYISEYERRT